MSEENNKNGSVSTLEDLLHIDDASSKTNGNKAPEPETLLVTTKHTLVTSPWSRLAIITIPFGVGFLAIFWMLNGVFNPAPAPKIAEKGEEKITTTEQAQQNEEGDGDARAKLALSDQASELNKINLNKKEQPAQVEVSQTHPVVPSKPPSPRGVPRPVQQQPRPAPQPIRTYTPPPTRTSFSPKPYISASARTLTPLDPFEQLNKLRSIGSYGKIAYAETSINNQSSLDPAQTQAVQNQSNEQADTNNFDQTTSQESSDSIEKIRPRWQVETQAKSDKYLGQERQIIQGKQTRYLSVGTFASGVLATPLVQATDNNSGQTSTPNSNRSVARLKEDLRDNYGQVALPAGTLLAVELASVDGGSVAIAHVRSIIKDNTEYPIGAGAISVTGEDGRPLIARRFQDRGGEIAGNDLFGGAVSALGKVGEMMNQPDSEEEIEDEFTGRIKRRSSGNRRNITGALLEGFFGQVSQNVSQRNQRATQEILSRPNAWFIPQGTKVTITVNRSLELP
ncbi:MULTISPECIES: TrbI/VirB10 family protein [Nostoc]|uniref:TrbI/VirB10 family protein n=1 Tax=Nostoc paludosum FACHB-159 TaxID=2692908 RepID=A0ABR8KIW2_9NOSO|nr:MULTISPECIES: TrbI/VirB10 family protein [Nostoc]MBD2683160.1 TrbI/VirB10 family protein [Nostoc sp. FACHB-857]MBD2739505.1 TrbI/VirB10 family protein [Nostoc paludosum FACHB-159]